MERFSGFCLRLFFEEGGDALFFICYLVGDYSSAHSPLTATVKRFFTSPQNR